MTRTRPLSTLIADDNPVVRAGLTALLTGRDDLTVVAQATNGREAHAAAIRTRPDVILLDVNMPDGDGIAALPHLTPLAPVLMLTYSRETETIREALRRGARGYLVHGEFTADELVTAVRAVHDGRAHLTPTAADALLTLVRDPSASAQHCGANCTCAPTTPGLRSDVERSHAHFDSVTIPSLSQGAVRQSSPGTGGLSRREVEIMDLIVSGLANHQIAAACFISEKTVKNHINRIFTKLDAGSRAEAIARWLGTDRGRVRGGHLA
ncbi:response regulator [Streptomyces sp. NPDC060194]|uniref:response regulator n=1 Tax=Streptomyces sp. NPDC060194 TaxID=3347069 RepID=UPI0036640627